jgi:hypothetical protein
MFVGKTKIGKKSYRGHDPKHAQPDAIATKLHGHSKAAEVFCDGVGGELGFAPHPAQSQAFQAPRNTRIQLPPKIFAMSTKE